jgi:NAD(P)-dependent dehydrogenase (short-subunit alcohol dehydrogenase family)
MDESMNERSLHVVLGTGPLGLAVARTLAAEGERVRAVSRSGLADLPDDVAVLRAIVTEPDQAKLVSDGTPSSATAPIHPARSSTATA